MRFLFGLLSGAIAVIALSQSRSRTQPAAKAVRRPRRTAVAAKPSRLPAYYRINLN